MKNYIKIAIIFINILVFTTICYSQIKKNAFFRIPRSIPDNIEVFMKDNAQKGVGNDIQCYRIREYNDSIYEIFNLFEDEVILFSSCNNAEILISQFKQKYKGYEKPERDIVGKHGPFGLLPLITFYDGINTQGNHTSLVLPRLELGYPEYLGLYFIIQENLGLSNILSHKCTDHDVTVNGINYSLEVVGNLLVIENYASCYETMNKTVNDYRDFCCQRNILFPLDCYNRVDNVNIVNYYYILDTDVFPPFTLNGSCINTQWHDFNETININSEIVNEDGYYKLKLECLNTPGWTLNHTLNSSEGSSLENGSFNLNSWCSGKGKSLQTGHYKVTLTSVYDWSNTREGRYMESSEYKHFYISDCHPSRTQTATINTTKTLKSQGTFNATNTIGSSGNVTYQAGGTITLGPGFKVQQGGAFKTQYGTCSY